MIRFKAGVMMKKGLVRVQPETFFAIDVAHEIFRNRNVACLVITSLLDGEHMKNSFHYKGLAVDIRLPYALDGYINAKELNQTIIDIIKGALGESYDCILEKDHLHIEFDPKYN